ncbi:MAG: metallophosphoesterase family protein [Verrucomicrobiales bacterium]
MPHRLLNLLGFAALLVSGPSSKAQDGPGEVQQLDWASWKVRCMALPSNQQILLNQAPPGRAAISAVQFDDLLNRFVGVQLGDALANEALWIGGKPDSRFFDSQLCYFNDPAVAFMPFAQKLSLAPGSRVIFNGDLHGDIRSLITTIGSWQQQGLLNGFRIVDPQTHVVFLGDYTDRGFYGVEVIATLARLKLENPDNVWFSRGNHEDSQLVSRYGFVEEMHRKFNDTYDVTKVMRLYDCLPVVIYVGSSAGDYLQCNHGGMEPGYDPETAAGVSSAAGIPADWRFETADLRRCPFGVTRCSGVS